jgi:hypothetical protein
MTNDLQELVQQLRSLSDRADQLARSLNNTVTIRHGGRVGMKSIETPASTASVPAANAAGMVSLAQLGQSCREFRNSVEAAIEGLPRS